MSGDATTPIADSKQFRLGSDSQQHDTKEKQQIEILLSFFKASRKFCVCIVDLVDSTAISRKLTDEQVARYYGLFLNRMAEIASSFGAVVVKNLGDSILYYFPQTENGSSDSFHTVLDCALAMLDEKQRLDQSMRSQGLPDVTYRISCEYGSVAIAKVSTSVVNDIFGSTVNQCAKINAMAPAGGIVIGAGMFDKVKSFLDFQFSQSVKQVQSRSDSTSGVESYSVYVVRPTRLI